MASTRHPSLCRSIGREEYKECFRDDLNKKSPMGLFLLDEFIACVIDFCKVKLLPLHYLGFIILHIGS